MTVIKPCLLEKQSPCPVRLIDFDDLSNNTYIVTNQYRIHHRETKIPDVVMMINGIPVVVGEAKTPIRPSVSWLDGAHEVHDIYENAVPQLFVPNILSFATEGKELYYGAIRCPLEFWAPWRLENDEDAIAKRLGLGEVGKELSDLLSPARLLDICSISPCSQQIKRNEELRSSLVFSNTKEPIKL